MITKEEIINEMITFMKNRYFCYFDDTYDDKIEFYYSKNENNKLKIEININLDLKYELKKIHNGDKDLINIFNTIKDYLEDKYKIKKLLNR